MDTFIVHTANEQITIEADDLIVREGLIFFLVEGKTVSIVPATYIIIKK